MTRKYFNNPVIVFMLVLGFFTASCDNLLNDDSNKPKTVKITGLSKYAGKYAMFFIGNLSIGNVIATTSVTLIESDGTVTGQLCNYTDDNIAWTGNGTYWGELVVADYSGYPYYYYGTINSLTINTETTTIPYNHTVTFNSNSGSEIAPMADVLIGETITKPTDPERTDYNFDGWYKDEILENIWHFSYDTVDQDIILYAKWNSIIKCNVSFNTNGGSSIEDMVNIISGNKIEKPEDPIKEGYIFRDWYKDEELSAIWNFDIDVVVDNITLFAKWEKLLTVSFNADGGNIINDIKNIIPGEKIEKLADPIKAGYIFKDWYKDEELSAIWNFDVDVVIDNITLFAKWRIIETIAPAEVTTINQTFDWAHNIVIHWTEPADEDFCLIKVYENDEYKTDVLKGTASYTVSTLDIINVTIKTVDDLNNVSIGEVFTLNWKEAGFIRIIIDNNNGSPVSGANVLGFASNKTTKSSYTNEKGAAYLEYANSQTITLLVAHSSYEGIIFSANTALNQDLTFTNNAKGSILAPTGTCYIPEFSGRLAPIRDSLNRTYLYATNIAINGGLQQPVYFNLTDPLNLEDANEKFKQVWIPFIEGDTALINYSPK